MSNSKDAPNPERLVAGRFGRLLRDANREFADQVDQPAAFRRVTERLSSARGPRPARNFWLVPATLLVLAGFAALPAAVRVGSDDDTPLVIAEDLRAFHAQPTTVASTVALAPTPSERATTRRADSRGASGANSNTQGTSAPVLANSGGQTALRGAVETREPLRAALPDVGVAGGPTAAPADTADTADTGTAPDCLSLARRGQTREAEACFLKRAEGSGLGAEMALYEVARLRRDVLADATGALAALSEYRARFPAGALRREADMSQLELLLQLGRSDEALKQSDQLLSSSSSGERAAELRLLRGHILRKAQSRFADAAREYELAERAGMRGGEVTYFRALCLEALGHGAEAAALFAQYLEQPQRAYAEDARLRLQKLNP
ncbi:MAG TPA: hypothetical protein VJV79_01835 [Polyangiaceae bacterium]|nr:hypothetical protein [Polyangiaceae bacterium]